MGKSTTASDKLTAAQRKAKCVQLRKAGYTQQEIADQVGISKAQVCRHLKKAMADYAEETEEVIKQVRAEDLAKLDQLWRSAYAKAIGGNLGAVDRCMKVLERRAKIYGYDAPTKVAPTSPDGLEEFGGGGLSALLAAAEAKGGSGN